MNEYNFGPASNEETIVYGGRRPGHTHTVEPERAYAWVAYMQAQGIQRVCCLLPERQLVYYTFDLLALYKEAFGEDNVCWAPVEDFSLCDRDLLGEKVLPFLDSSQERQQKVVVHCAGGIGRTGQILAAWLVHGRGYSIEQAIRAVGQTSAERDPLEAVHLGRIAQENLYSILESVMKS